MRKKDVIVIEEVKTDVIADNANKPNEEKKANLLSVPDQKIKTTKSEENLDNNKKTKKMKNFYNALPFNCGKIMSASKKAEKEAAKSEEKPKKALEILLKRVVPELDLNLFGFSAKLMNHLKFYFRYFYDNRMNFLLKEKRKFYKKKAISQKQEDLVFKPELGKKTAKFAEEYRKKCKQQIQEEFNHQENNAEQGTKSNSLKLEEIYNVLRLKKENEIARLKLQQNEELMKKCTFQPNSNKETKSPKTVNTVEVSKKLHVDANQRKLKKKNIEEEKKKRKRRSQ